MNILVATDGALSRKRTAEAVGRYYREGDVVFVFTAVNLPSDVLRQLGDSGVKAASQIALEAGQTLGAGDRAAERLIKSISTKPRPKVDSPILAGLAETAKKRMRPMVKALEEAGVEVGSFWRTTDNRTAKTILSAMKECDTDLLVIGSHGRGKYEGALGSTGSKLVRSASSSVLVIRKPQEDLKKS
jgi:nucleotide-binding universal stress UspA family protein